MKKNIVLLLCMLLFCSCGSNKKRYVPHYDDSNMNENEVTVPFREDGGVRMIQVKINDCVELPMIFDTGCSGLSISIVEAYALAKQGCITASDIKGYGYATIADGSIVENMIINLKKIQIGQIECYNVEATVMEDTDAPLLLGNGVLNQVESFSIDNIEKTITFYLH